MQKIIVQVYEINDPEEAEILINMGVDHVGSVILSKDEYRDSSIKDVIKLTKELNAKSSLIPLYSDIDAILETIYYYKPDIIHFCESFIESLKFTNEEMLKKACILAKMQRVVKNRFPDVKIMRSIPIPLSGSSCFMQLSKLINIFESVSDYFLTDTLILSSEKSDLLEDQPVDGFVGITGRTCDWNMSRQLVLESKIPVILAGGISPDNVGKGIAHVKPFGVDSCTQTNAVDLNGESVRFKKDIKKVGSLIYNVNQASAALL